MLIGAVWAWLPRPNTPKWRAMRIGFIAYFYLFVIFFVWKSIIGYAIVAVVALGLLVFMLLRWQNSN
jgi:apolipoprotein N-acyltransferase